MKDNYYTPEFEEFVLGFEFESIFWYFAFDDDWAKAVITEKNIEDFKCLYKSDAYPSEFRKLKP